VGGTGGLDVSVSGYSYDAGGAIACSASRSIHLVSNVKVSNQTELRLQADQIRIDGVFSVAGNSRLRVFGWRQPLNDTGVVTCVTPDLSFDCPIWGFMGQDAEYGRDVSDRDDSDGLQGFSFTKLDANGDAVSRYAASARCVRDNVTGLVWESKTSRLNQLHSNSHKFTWYDPDPTSNGGSSGDTGKLNICHGYDANRPETYCNTRAFVARVRQEKLCGFDDWRLPNIQELRSLASYDLSASNALDWGYFYDSQTNGFYWSAQSRALDSGWARAFLYGQTTNDSALEKNSYLGVMLVRGGNRP